MKETATFFVSALLLPLFRGALIGLGAALPGVSGGVLCVIFGIYQTGMEFLADPWSNAKTHLPRLLPVALGGIMGFWGVSKVLSVLLKAYPAPSLCLFVGLILGMLPSLFRQAKEKGQGPRAWFSLFTAMFVSFFLLTGLKAFSFHLTPSFGWYGFCGFCLALSIILPGMSFSTLLMPLGLYEPFVAGIGNLNFGVLIPGGIGGLITLLLLTKAMNTLFQTHHSVAFHAILGIVIAATVVIIPFAGFTASVGSCLTNLLTLLTGLEAAYLLDRFNQKYTLPVTSRSPK